MRKNKESDLAKAKAYAFLLLKFRPRSEAEIAKRLKKKFDQAIVDGALQYLKKARFVDDENFAKAWIESRKSRLIGLERIRSELKAKGVAEKIVVAKIKEAAEGYQESRIVLELIRQKQDKLKAIEPEKAKKRLFLYLLRRGFSPETIFDALDKS